MGRFESPRMIIPTNDEREMLLRYLHRQRELVVVTADGLTDDRARWTPGERLLPIIGIINHLARVEWRWIQGRYLRHPFPPRHEEFSLDAHVSLAEVVDAYWDQGQQTDELVRAAPNLEVPCIGQEGEYPPANVLLGVGEALDLRWVILHLIEETAHHAGHADATRELLDGTKQS